MQEMIGQYIVLENYFMSESLTKVGVALSLVVGVALCDLSRWYAWIIGLPPPHHLP